MNDITKKISRKIVNGKELSIHNIQVILSILDGKCDYTLLSQIQSGEVIPYKLNKGIDKYISKLEPKRPSRNSTETRNMIIALDYYNLKKHMKRDDILKKLKDEAVERYGLTLSENRVSDCVTDGKNNLKLFFELHSNDENVVNEFYNYISNNPDIAKSKTNLFEFMTEEE